MGEEETDVDMGKVDGNNKETTNNALQSSRLRVGRGKCFMISMRKVLRIVTESRSTVAGKSLSSTRCSERETSDP